ncbi:UDP-N-acetylmuramoyl-tripeptide--D-alanyl-D-alanine ligase [Angustibacter luteus]|uniref:UDP-N-acetylmuramoyl-tripeptide--D-alanyl-D-alanine ligase n=1 Tax=Angustibacter luteus TaxID=658456 RepID=A0ABW1J9K4_9ACTN
MIPLTLAELAAATGARLHGDPTTLVDGEVVTDARLCGPGSLYVARRGEHADGMDYVPQAVGRGAVAVLAERPADELGTLVVDDVQLAFGAIAHEVAQRVPGLRVVAITGSSGKTSTKDLLAQVLAEHGPTVATVESYNGEVGVPLTVCRVEPGTAHVVVEMGARGLGHIRYLTEIVRPDVAVVLNVGAAHVGEFGSVEVIARAKAELVQALTPDGVAVLNADDPRVRAMAGATAGRVVLVGRSEDAEVRAADVLLDDQARASFSLQRGAEAAPVRLALHGEHQVGNALAVAAVALELGMSLPDVAQALGRARPASRWRMEVTERPDGVRIVNDAYNANPDSMRAALKALASMGEGRRTWAVLGEMLELGDSTIDEHDRIGRLAVRLNVSRLVAVGPGARAIHTGATQEGSWGEESMHVPDVEAAYALLAEQLKPGDVVLLKSSRDAGLRHLGDRLAGVGA